ncbi:FAD-dependent oxidoreductase [Castellaniella sp.]|uniref:oxidoreductase n=1 Tax=Castellaniella sp. TaxID=1955812 RepID=UPI003563E21F
MYAHVLSPIQIGSVTVRNRIVRTAHATLFSRGYITDDIIAYHLARARAQVGLSIIEGASVHPSSTFALSVRDDESIRHMARLVKAIEPTGMKLFQQLWHGGHTDPSASGGLPWAVSTLPARYAVAPPVAMTTDQAAELVDAYAQGALRVQAAGMQGVEILAGNGYLFSQFFSPVLNPRTDQYGGEFENRIRLLLDVLRAIRHATGPEFVLGVRIGDSSDPRILSAKETNAIARRLEQEGLVDFVNITHGDYYFHVERYAAMDEPVGYQLPYSDEIGRGLTVPRIIVGRYGTLDDAEQALKEGHADLVNMVRAMIADPQLITKTLAGRATEVKPCIACNQGCIGGLFSKGRMGCTVNPAVGYEATLSEDLIRPAVTPRRVVVVGAGVAGLEAARIARLGGHEVILLEAAPHLGGLVSRTRHAPRLHALGDMAVWQENEVYRLGVDVRLSCYAEADDVLALSPDAVIVATGALAPDPRDMTQTADPAGRVAIAPDARVVDFLGLMNDKTGDFGQTALVFDDVGHYEAIACCELLIDRGVQVTYLTRHLMFAPAMETTGRAQAALRRFHAARQPFQMITQGALVAIRRGEAVIRPLFGQVTQTIAADTVVPVCFRQPNNALWAALRGRVNQLHLVGDALSPRDMQPAIQEGHLAARSIE